MVHQMERGGARSNVRSTPRRLVAVAEAGVAGAERTVERGGSQCTGVKGNAFPWVCATALGSREHAEQNDA